MLMGINTNRHSNEICVLYVSLILFAQLVVIVSGREQIIWTASEADHKSLQAIKRGLVDPTGALRSWKKSVNGTENACSGKWAGIKCSKGQVIAIQLPWKALGGKISDEIGDLRSLRRISLHGNFLSGEIPGSLSLLPNLRGLYLFDNRLSGEVPPSLSRCRNLQTLDLSNNLLSGPVPASLADPPRLLRLNLSFNSLSGPIPGALFESSSLQILALRRNRLSGPIPSFVNRSRITRLQTLDLGANRLSGKIPVSLGGLKNLSSLTLGENRLSGEIPESLENLPSLATLDLSRNNLSGRVPEKLSDRFNSTSFSGNVELCGFSAATACPSLPPPPPSHAPESPSPARKARRHLSTKDILLIAAGALLLTLLALLCCLLICCLLRRRKRSSGGEKGNSGKAPAESPAAAEFHSGGEAGGKLVHFDGPLAFTADDLLCATAEIMGKSGYGTCYKASLEDGHDVAVKRLREKTTKGHKEFEAEATALAKIRHPNILALRAYYLGPKGEKLLVYDYMPKGSLASFLHARGPETAIDWATRLNIAIGVARGLVYLHTEQNTSHGNITSGNILLDDRAEPHIADTGLSRLTTGAAAATATAGSTGYSAPEVTAAAGGKRPLGGPKADVYGLGVVVLELLTGKSPGEPTTNGMELPQWVASIVKEEWTNEVFDLELMRDAPAIGDDLLNVLKLALHCVDPSPEARPDSGQVLAQLEDVKAQAQQQSRPEGGEEEESSSAKE